jgi:HlyD family secretion protein
MRIERILVAQGDVVTPGQLLAILEGHDQAQAQLGLAEAEKARTNHQRSFKKQKLALEREHFDKLQKARTDSSFEVLASKQRFEQIGKLYKQLLDDKNLAPKDRFDIELRYFEAENQKLRGELDVKSIQISQQLTPKQRELEDKELDDKNPDLQILDRQIELARQGLAQTEARAPQGGQILELMSHAGEVSSGPLLVMGDLSAMAATAEVYQSDVPRLSIGDSATVQILDQSLAGKVARIGSIVSRNQIANLDPRALQDRRVVKVTINLQDPLLARRLVNMEVDVAIEPGSSTGNPKGTRE